ncbi:MAG TPA: hypothetical protein VND22_09410 [Actinomycetota bacterium]|nr:hypothetical protein [Actinomycetota bacterium]
MGIIKKALGLAAIGAVAAWVSGKKRKDDAAMWEDVGYAGQSRSHTSWQESSDVASAADSMKKETGSTATSVEAETPAKKAKPQSKAAGEAGPGSNGADAPKPEGGA